MTINENAADVPVETGRGRRKAKKKNEAPLNILDTYDELVRQWYDMMDRI